MDRDMTASWRLALYPELVSFLNPSYLDNLPRDHVSVLNHSTPHLHRINGHHVFGT